MLANAFITGSCAYTIRVLSYIVIEMVLLFGRISHDVSISNAHRGGLDLPWRPLKCLIVSAYFVLTVLSSGERLTLKT